MTGAPKLDFGVLKAAVLSLEPHEAVEILQGLLVRVQRGDIGDRYRIAPTGTGVDPFTEDDITLAELTLAQRYANVVSWVQLRPSEQPAHLMALVRARGEKTHGWDPTDMEIRVGRVPALRALQEWITAEAVGPDPKGAAAAGSPTGT